MALNLQSILDAAGAADPDKRAETISTAILDGKPSREDVDTLLNEAVEKFGALNAEESVNEDSMLGLELLAEVCSAARGAQGTIDEQATEVKAQRDALAAKASGEQDAAEDETPAPEAEAEAEAETVEPVAEVEAPAAEAVPEPVAAAATPTPRRYDLSKIKSKAPESKPDQSTDGGLVITAAADVRGFAGGPDCRPPRSRRRGRPTRSWGRRAGRQAGRDDGPTR